MLGLTALLIASLLAAAAAAVWAGLLALGEEAAVGEALHTLGDAPPKTVGGHVALHRALHVSRLALLVLGAVAAAHAARWWERAWPPGLLVLGLAAEARLPDAVAAFIPEHHGTSEITYFLDRAKKSGDGGTPQPSDYTYPGPRPRSKETAIAMLADSVEAALRVLEELTPHKIAEVISHIVRNKLNQGQLDEAPMTLQQLEEAKAEFVRIITGMYHNRIDYPESSGGITATWQPAAKS